MFRKLVLFPSSGGKIRARDPTPLGPLPDLVFRTRPYTHNIYHTPREPEERTEKGRLGYSLDNQTIEARFSAEAWQFPVVKNAQNGCEAHPTIFSTGTCKFSSKGKTTGTWSSPPSSAESKHECPMPLLPNTPSCRGQETLYVTIYASYNFDTRGLGPKTSAHGV
jgi:hypothetical protein